MDARVAGAALPSSSSSTPWSAYQTSPQPALTRATTARTSASLAALGTPPRKPRSPNRAWRRAPSSARHHRAVSASSSGFTGKPSNVALAVRKSSEAVRSTSASCSPSGAAPERSDPTVRRASASPVADWTSWRRSWASRTKLALPMAHLRNHALEP
ncbi:hypothetical protein ACN28S_23970 [Cystobacter fuscus]